jgi:hypothetical protein
MTMISMLASHSHAFTPAVYVSSRAYSCTSMGVVHNAVLQFSPVHRYIPLLTSDIMAAGLPSAMSMPPMSPTGSRHKFPQI